MKTKYIIVDDETVAHDIIEKYCNLLPSMQLMAHCYDAIEAIEFLQAENVDLIFLDLNMPKLKGFDFLRTLTHPPKVIVTTAYREHALEGYELNIVDYLLKPFSFERFLKAVNKVVQSSERSAESIVSSQEQPRKVDRIFFQANKKHYQILLDDLLFVEASGNYTKIHLINEIITIREKLSAVQQMLPINEFVQVHRSFIVSAKKIKRIEGNQIILENHVVPIGKSYRDALNKILG